MSVRAAILGLAWVAMNASATPIDIVGSAAVGSTPANVLPLVGDWVVRKEGASTVTVVDGSRWREGVASPKLDEMAATAFPNEGKAFAAAVRRHALFPLAIVNDVPALKVGTVTVRFRAIAGREDRAAGIAFAVQPNGDYLILRANALEDNLILFQFKDGRRSTVKEVGGVKTKSGLWHELRLDLDGNSVKGSVDGKVYLQHDTGTSQLGRIGLWSKADSVVQFSDLTVESRAR